MTLPYNTCSELPDKLQFATKNRSVFAPVFAYSGHFQAELSAAQDVEVEVVDGLAGVVAAVANNAVAVFQAFRLGDGGDHLKNVGHNGGIFRGDLGDAADVGLGDHQNVGGSLGGNVPEGQNLVVLIHLGGGDHPCCDLAE